MSAGRAVAIAIGALLAFAPSAMADPVADQITQELVQDGLPNVAVSVATPPAATAADAATFADDPTATPPSITPSNALSPDPSNPQPVVTVSFGATTPTSTPGTVTPPGEPGSYTNDAQTAEWNADIVQAVKHAEADGAQVAGVVGYQPAIGTRDVSQPAVYVPSPDPTDFPPAPTDQTTQTMTAGAVQVRFALDLPAAYSGASVSVDDDTSGQRVVTVQYDQPASAFATDDLSELSDWAAAEQAMLDDPLQGGNVGQVVVKSNDSDPASPTYGVTVFTRSMDATWGMEVDWAAPQVASFVDQSSSDQATP